MSLDLEIGAYVVDLEIGAYVVDLEIGAYVVISTCANITGVGQIL